VLRAARWKCGTQKSPKIRRLSTIAQLCRTISSQLRHVSTIEKKLWNSNVSPHMPHDMVNVGPLAAEICWRVWGIPANFNGCRVLAALLHDTVVVVVSQTLRRWTKGATYIRQGGHHVGCWPIFLVFLPLYCCNNRTVVEHNDYAYLWRVTNSLWWGAGVAVWSEAHMVQLQPHRLLLH